MASAGWKRFVDDDTFQNSFPKFPLFVPMVPKSLPPEWLTSEHHIASKPLHFIRFKIATETFVMSWNTENMSLRDDLDFMSELNFDDLFDLNSDGCTDVSSEGGPTKSFSAQVNTR